MQQPCFRQTPRGGMRMAMRISQQISHPFAIFELRERSERVVEESGWFNQCGGTAFCYCFYNRLTIQYFSSTCFIISYFYNFIIYTLKIIIFFLIYIYKFFIILFISTSIIHALKVIHFLFFIFKFKDIIETFIEIFLLILRVFSVRDGRPTRSCHDMDGGQSSTLKVPPKSSQQKV